MYCRAICVFYKGREYAIRLSNPYDVRVAVALSVDGLNTIDARHTTASDARRFDFTTEARAYGAAPVMIGGTRYFGAT